MTFDYKRLIKKQRKAYKYILFTLRSTIIGQ